MDSWNLGRRGAPDGEQRIRSTQNDQTGGGLNHETKTGGALPEKTGYTKYFEHDGALRAYANRMMWFGISAVLISFVLALLLFYVRVQPPTVIRIAANGEATVVSGAHHNAADAPGVHERLGRLFGSRRATRGH